MVTIDQVKNFTIGTVATVYDSVAVSILLSTIEISDLTFETRVNDFSSWDAFMLEQSKGSSL